MPDKVLSLRMYFDQSLSDMLHQENNAITSGQKKPRYKRGFRIQF